MGGYLMSLTSFIKIKDVKDKFNQEFNKPIFRVKKQILAPPLTKNPQLVGTAFDYLMRFKLKLINPEAITSDWIAEKVPEIEKNNNELYEKVTKILKKSKENYQHYLEYTNVNEKCDKSLIKSTLLLAKLDNIFRSGSYEDLNVVDDEDIEDLEKLISLVNPEIFRFKEKCILNPNFKNASMMVGGADADLIIDRILIDIKTLKTLEFRRDVFNQLMGYYVLYNLAYYDIEFFPIEKIGIYFSRFGYLHIMDVKDIINKDTYQDFVEWFIKRAEEEYGSGFLYMDLEYEDRIPFDKCPECGSLAIEKADIETRSMTEGQLICYEAGEFGIIHCLNCGWEKDYEA